MKQILIWLLDVVARILSIITIPLKFILKWVLPGPGPNEPLPGENEPGIISPATPTPLEKPIFPAVSKPRMIGMEEPIKPAEKVKQGWFALPLEFLPNPTYWPVVLGLGIIFGVFGAVTNFIFIIIGIVLFIMGLIGWIGDLWNEQPEQ